MVIFGVDQQDHDTNLINLLNVCQKEGLVLNSKKLELQRERVTFFGAEYSAQGMHPDPKKVQGITEMTVPKDKQQLQSFLGTVNYMGTFNPNLSHHTELLRAMLKKDNVFHWDGNAPSERENSVISGCQQLANGQKTVLSANNRKGSIKQTNTSQVLVSETAPGRRVQLSRRAKMTRFGDNPMTSTVPIPPRRQPGRDTSTRNRREFKLNMTDPDLLIPIKQTRVTTRHSDLREPQPSSSDSQPASSQPVSETTTSESSVSLPSSGSCSSSTESTSTSGTDSSSSETSSESSSQPSSNASSPETSSSAGTSWSTSPKLLEMECSFNSLLAGTRDCQGHPVTRSQMHNLRDQQQHIAVLKQVPSQLQNQPWPVSAPPVANMPLPLYPRRRPSDKGSKKQVQAENANAPHKSSDSETDRLQDIQEEPRRCIGPSRVKELAKFFMPTSDEEENS